MADRELIDLERAGWEALTAGGPTAAGFYSDVLARRVLMLLPGGLVIDDRRQAIDSMAGAPWDAYEMSDERVLPLGDGCAVVAYEASARRGDQEYRALFNSTYLVEDGRWRLTLHQQTPA